MYAWLFTHLTWLSSAAASYAEHVHGLGGWFVRSPDRDWASDAVADQGHAETAVTFALATTTAFVGYVAAIWLGRGVRGRPVVSLVLVFAMLFQVIGVLAPDMLSEDVFSYASYGRMLAVYGANPQVEVPAAYPNDLYYDYLFWKFVPSFYGPLWTLISAGLVRIAGDDVALAVLLFRAVEAVSALFGTVAVFAILETVDPRRAIAGTILFGWNPLLVIEAGLSGHNDVLMVALMTLAVGLAAKRRGVLACGALVLAGLVKYTAFALVPLLGLFLLRQTTSWAARARLVALSGLVCLPLTAAIVWPVWAGPATFAVGALGSGSDRYVNSLGELALGELRASYGERREDLEIPLQFHGWWLATHTPTVLLPAQDAAAEPLAVIDQWQELLLVAPERLHWMKVFDPATRQIGYVRSGFVGPIERPDWAAADEDVLRLEAGPSGTDSLRAANRDIRIVGWGAFILVYCAALVLGTGSLAALLRSWTIVLLVLLYVTLTWFWPWYALWALPAAALLPRSAWSRLVVWFSWGVLWLYVALGFQETNLWYIQTYRAIPAFGLPLLLWLGESGLRSVVRAGRRSWSGRAATARAAAQVPAAAFAEVQAEPERPTEVSSRTAEGSSRSRA